MKLKVYKKENGEFLSIPCCGDGIFKNDNTEVHVEQVSADTVRAIYVSAKSNVEFDSETAVRLVLENIDGLESYVTGSSTYTDYNCWYAPVFGTDIRKISPVTQSVIWKTKENYGALLSICDKEYKSEMTGCKYGLAIDVFDNNSGEFTVPKSLAAICVTGENPFVLNKKAVSAAIKLLGRKSGTRYDRHFPGIFEYLGWCSWDAFQIRVSECNLVSKCEEFKKKNIPVKWAIIDDMWADCTELDTAEYDDFETMMKIMKASRLNSFEASHKRFPKGLKHAVNRMNEYGIKVGIWHPTTGYWKGITPDTEFFKKYKDELVLNTAGWYQPKFEENAFFEDFYAYLKACGCEFLKMDNQSSFHFNRNMAPIGKLASALHNNIESAAKKYFDNTIINCMGLATENMWARPESAVVRCSDDFQPENKAWFRKHILQCTFNSLFIGEIMWCDYDMWWTDDNQALKNSLLRAVSGGPVYVSDTLERSKREVLMPLILEDGRILRCDRPGIPTLDSMFINPGEGTGIYKVQNICGDSGIIAVYNLTDNKAYGTVSPADVFDLPGNRFVMYEHFTKKTYLLSKDDAVEIELENDEECRLFVIIPQTDITFMGLTEKFISPKTYERLNDSTFILKETGKFAFICESAVVKVLSGGKECKFENYGNFYEAEAHGKEIEIITAE